MTQRKRRACHGRRPVPSLTAKEWPEAIELVRTMSGAAVKVPEVVDRPAVFLADFIGQCCQMMPGPSYFSALAKCGVWFTGYTPPEAYPAPLAKWIRFKPPLPQQCFYNSLLAVISGPAEELGLSYFEGQVTLPTAPFPIEHAWLGADHGGPAVDLTFPTVENRRENVPAIRAGAVYCGVKVPVGLLTRLTIAEEIARPWLADWLAAAVDYVERLE